MKERKYPLDADFPVDENVILHSICPDGLESDDIFSIICRIEKFKNSLECLDFILESIHTLQDKRVICTCVDWLHHLIVYDWIMIKISCEFDRYKETLLKELFQDILNDEKFSDAALKILISEAQACFFESTYLDWLCNFDFFNDVLILMPCKDDIYSFLASLHKAFIHKFSIVAHPISQIQQKMLEMGLQKSIALLVIEDLINGNQIAFKGLRTLIEWIDESLFIDFEFMNHISTIFYVKGIESEAFHCMISFLKRDLSDDVRLDYLVSTPLHELCNELWENRDEATDNAIANFIQCLIEPMCKNIECLGYFDVISKLYESKNYSIHSLAANMFMILIEYHSSIHEDILQISLSSMKNIIERNDEKFGLQKALQIIMCISKQQGKPISAYFIDYLRSYPPDQSIVEYSILLKALTTINSISPSDRALLLESGILSLEINSNDPIWLCSYVMSISNIAYLTMSFIIKENLIEYEIRLLTILISILIIDNQNHFSEIDSLLSSTKRLSVSLSQFVSPNNLTDLLFDIPIMDLFLSLDQQKISIFLDIVNYFPVQSREGVLFDCLDLIGDTIQNCPDNMSILLFNVISTMNTSDCNSLLENLMIFFQNNIRFIENHTILPSFIKSSLTHLRSHALTFFWDKIGNSLYDIDVLAKIAESLCDIIDEKGFQIDMNQFSHQLINTIPRAFHALSKCSDLGHSSEFLDLESFFTNSSKYLIHHYGSISDEDQLLSLQAIVITAYKFISQCDNQVQFLDFLSSHYDTVYDQLFEKNSCFCSIVDFRQRHDYYDTEDEIMKILESFLNLHSLLYLKDEDRTKKMLENSLKIGDSTKIIDSYIQIMCSDHRSELLPQFIRVHFQIIDSTDFKEEYHADDEFSESYEDDT